MLIFGMGLYGLFISNIPTGTPSRVDRALKGSSLFGMFALKERPKWMQISSLDELKTKVGHVIVMILLVKMFERSKMVTIATGMDLFSRGVPTGYVRVISGFGVVARLGMGMPTDHGRIVFGFGRVAQPSTAVPTRYGRAVFGSGRVDRSFLVLELWHASAWACPPTTVGSCSVLEERHNQARPCPPDMAGPCLVLEEWIAWEVTEN
ncbi:hypothetical protein ZIOFF_009127 [Zingiber officinale]|uniref:Uncharacterized protein n=1 Tax=Zingiber officinale TaxID=94328 RepID=A0A8J5HMI8_ZINOF|nr:hypothetical protein ZIOFF_009127 [Zingiber officinale]